MIESMNGGGFLSLMDDEAYKFLEDLSESSQQWDFSNRRERSALAIKKGGLYEIREDLDMKAKLDNLTHKVEILALGRGVNSFNQVQCETCSICASPIHTTQRQNQPPTNVGGQQMHQQSQFYPPTQAYSPIP